MYPRVVSEYNMRQALVYFSRNTRSTTSTSKAYMKRTVTFESCYTADMQLRKGMSPQGLSSSILQQSERKSRLLYASMMRGTVSLSKLASIRSQQNYIATHIIYMASNPIDYFAPLIHPQNQHHSTAQQFTQDTMHSIAQSILEGEHSFKEPTIPQITSPKPVQVTEEDRKSFINKLKHQRKKMQEQKERLKKIQQQKELAKLKEQNDHKIEEEEKRKESRRKEVEVNILAREQQMSEKMKQFRVENASLKQKMREKAKFIDMEERYRKFQNSLLEQRNEKLSKLHEQYVPLDWGALRRDGDKKCSKSKSPKERPSLPPITVFYKSSWYEQQRKSKRGQQQSQSLQILAHKKEDRQKLQKYAEYVRNKFKPPQKSESNLQPSSAHRNINPEEARAIGLRYLQYSKSHTQATILNSQNQSEAKGELQQSRYTNYMKEFPVSNQDTSVKSFLKSVERKDLPQFYRTRQIMDFALRKEEEAKRKEKVNILGDSDGSQYLQAIEAKLALLK